MLLALRDEKGTLESKATMYAYALGGAMLAELSLKGKIRISDDKKAFVDLVDRSPFGEPVLDECLDKVATAKRRARATTWVRRFAELKRLRHRVAQGLCRRGILRDDEDKVLLFFTRRLYPTIDPVPERRLVDQLRTVIFGDSSSPDAETVIVVALANATGLLPIHFDRKELAASQAAPQTHYRGDDGGRGRTAGRRCGTAGCGSGSRGRKLRRSG